MASDLNSIAPLNPFAEKPEEEEKEISVDAFPVPTKQKVDLNNVGISIDLDMDEAELDNAGKELEIDAVIVPTPKDVDDREFSIVNISEQLTNRPLKEGDDVVKLKDTSKLENFESQQSLNKLLVAHWEGFDVDVEEGVTRIEDTAKGWEDANAEYSSSFARQQIESMLRYEATKPSGYQRKALEDGIVNRYNNISSALEDSSNPVRQKLATELIDAGLDINSISYVMNGSEWTPFLGTAMGVLDIPDTLESSRQMWLKGDRAKAVGFASLAAAELAASIVGAGMVIRKGKEIVTGEISQSTVDQMAQITRATQESAAETVSLASNTAANAPELQARLAEEWMQVTLGTGSNAELGVLKIDADGNQVIDFERMREAGLSVAEEVKELQDARARVLSANNDPTIKPQQADLDIIEAANERMVKSETGADTLRMDEDQSFTGLTEEVGDLVSPLVRPEKFNALVSIASEYAKNNPGAFPKDKTIIDSLFELTVANKFDVEKNQELADLLSKYGLSFDEYVLSIAGSGSEAGKILNKLSQIRKTANLSELDMVREKVRAGQQGKAMQVWRRLENMRRGAMVSQFKTAMRNLQSAGMRVPMEAVENLFDSAMYAMQQDGVKGLLKQVNPLSKTGYYTGSMAQIKYIFSQPKMASELTEFLLKRPEFEKMHDNLLNNINEYQKALGSGSDGGPAWKVTDAILKRGEGFVDIINTPNRLQEHLIRKGVFMGELERLVERHYKITTTTTGPRGEVITSTKGVDFTKALKEGKLQDFISNSSTVRGKGSPKFEELLEQATRRALDVTYAKAPDIQVFKDASNFITRNGLTPIIPFPRFMFNSMELMAQYSAGAFNPALKHIFGSKKGRPLDAKDRQNISRNITGLAAISAAYQYRQSQDADSDYKVMTGRLVEEGMGVDVTPQFPLRQMLWIGEAMKRLDPDSAKRSLFPAAQLLGRLDGDNMQGTFNDWFDPKEFMETFAGTTFRTGTGNVFIDEIAKLAGGAGTPESDQKAADAVGKAVGQYINSFLSPMRQVLDVQRMLELRPSEKMTTTRKADRPILTGSATENLYGAFKYSFNESLDQGQILTGAENANLFNPSQEFNMEARAGGIQYEDASDPKLLKNDPTNEGFTGKNLRGNPIAAFFGITMRGKKNEAAQYLQEKGFPVWKFESRTKEPDIKAAEDALMLSYMPLFLKDMKRQEAGLIKEYQKNIQLHGELTQEQYVNRQVIVEIEKQMTVYKSFARQIQGGDNTFGITLPQVKALKKRQEAVREQMETVRKDGAGINSDKYRNLQEKLKEIQLNFFDTVGRAEYLKIPKSIKVAALERWKTQVPNRKFDPNKFNDVIQLKGIVQGINAASALVPKAIKQGLMSR